MRKKQNKDESMYDHCNHNAVIIHAFQQLTHLHCKVQLLKAAFRRKLLLSNIQQHVCMLALLLSRAICTLMCGLLIFGVFTPVNMDLQSTAGQALLDGN